MEDTNSRYPLFISCYYVKNILLDGIFELIECTLPHTLLIKKF